MHKEGSKPQPSLIPAGFDDLNPGLSERSIPKGHSCRIMNRSTQLLAEIQSSTIPVSNGWS